MLLIAILTLPVLVRLALLIAALLISILALITAILIAVLTLVSAILIAVLISVLALIAAIALIIVALWPRATVLTLGTRLVILPAIIMAAAIAVIVVVGPLLIGLRLTGWLLRSVGLLLRCLREPLRRRSEPVGQATEIVVFFVVFRLGLAGLALRPKGCLLLSLLSCGDKPEIMLGVLKITFSHHRVAGGLRVTRKLQIFFANVMGSAADFNIRAV